MEEVVPATLQAAFLYFQSEMPPTILNHEAQKSIYVEWPFTFPKEWSCFFFPCHPHYLRFQDELPLKIFSGISEEKDASDNNNRKISWPIQPPVGKQKDEDKDASINSKLSYIHSHKMKPYLLSQDWAPKDKQTSKATNPKSTFSNTIHFPITYSSSPSYNHLICGHSFGSFDLANFEPKSDFSKTWPRRSLNGSTLKLAVKRA